MVAPMIAAAGISAGASLLGGLLGSKTAKKQLEEAKRQFNEQQAYMRERDAASDAFSQQIFGMVPQLLDRTYAQEDYYRTFNNQQRDAALELMNYLRGWDVQNADWQNQGWDYATGAQSLRDTIAAENRRYDLERIARNDSLSASEREYALAQLARTQGIAASERATEASDIASFNDTRADEYRDRYARLLQDRQTRASERDYEQNKQDMVLARAAQMRDAVQRVLSEQGTLTAPKLQGPEDISKIATERGKVYTDILDRLSEKQMSGLEASLINRGMDTGGDSGEQRAELLARLAPEYQKALLTAAQEASGIVEGNNKTLMDRFNALRTARETALNEAQLGEGAGVDLITRLGELNSGVLDRDVGSSAEYIRRASSELGVQGPLAIGSAIYEGRAPSDGVSQYIGTPTRNVSASNQGMSYDIKALPSYDWSGLIGQSINARGGQNAGQLLTSAQQNYQQAGMNFGTAQERFGRTIDSLFDKGLDWLSNQKDWSFMRGNTPSNVASKVASMPSFTAGIFS